ncbi:nitroreductase family protein [Butyrivibrio sp. INlla16]|uniref:nitroreductase family protein n=1 Tax=Butyrivibrio sp. INlla16 TaxID=1520807 RepID=UPI000883D29B|nr:nitroreductase family protein [Butyrivibrio sp. INlla16]SDB50207.1 Putative TM nitroreductase [Butyrivibrio sp. INlla16]
MSEIDAIKKRHSVRNYEDVKIEQSKVDKLNALIAECNKEGNLHIQFLEDAGKTFNKLLNKFMGLGSAPSVIACIGPDDDTLDERIGYYGERIVLTAQELGLNTCWAGTYNSSNVKAEISDGERLAIVIAIGYGQDGGKPHKSKSMEDVISVKGDRPYWFNSGVEMALLAPTAINQQKFEIRLNEDNSVEFVDKGGILSKIDLGIVKYHFEVGKKYAMENH